MKYEIRSTKSVSGILHYRKSLQKWGNSMTHQWEVRSYRLTSITSSNKVQLYTEPYFIRVNAFGAHNFSTGTVARERNSWPASNRSKALHNSDNASLISDIYYRDPRRSCSVPEDSEQKEGRCCCQICANSPRRISRKGYVVYLVSRC